MGLTHVTDLGHIPCFKGFDWLMDIAQLTQMSQMIKLIL